MNFSGIVNACREFSYEDKKGNERVGYSIDVTLSNYEVYSFFSSDPFNPGDPCVMVIRAGKFNKPVISLVRPVPGSDMPF